MHLFQAAVVADHDLLFFFLDSLVNLQEPVMELARLRQRELSQFGAAARALHLSLVARY